VAVLRWIHTRMWFHVQIYSISEAERPHMNEVGANFSCATNLCILMLKFYQLSYSPSTTWVPQVLVKHSMSSGTGQRHSCPRSLIQEFGGLR